MQVKEVRLADCSRELYKKFYSLNLRSNGSMRRRLAALRADKNSPSIIHYIESEKEILGWTLSFPDNFIQRYKSYFYVRKENRKQGFGTKLFRTVERFFIENDLRFKIYPHDNKSFEFFTKCTKGKCTDMKNSLIHVAYYSYY